MLRRSQVLTSLPPLHPKSFLPRSSSPPAQANAHSPPTTTGTHPAHVHTLRFRFLPRYQKLTSAAPLSSANPSSRIGSCTVMVYTSAKPSSWLLKQLDSFTSAILGSPGSAKMMSTHCGRSVSSRAHPPAARLHPPVQEQGKVAIERYGATHRIQSSAVLRQLNNLDRRLVPRLDLNALRQRHLRQADRARIRAV